jgi:hypothetical protein
MDHFAELFVFNGLPTFSFRRNRNRRPARTKRRAGFADQF